MSNDVTIQWVSSDGQIRHVSEFGHLAPPDRPATTCLECGEPVVLKLGTAKAFHAAHRPDSGCTLANGSPESALHFNCKMHLANELALPLTLHHHCGQCANPDWLTSVLALDWHTVVVERGIGTGHRPDLLLTFEGDPVLGIEVRQTHTVGMDKALALDEAGIGWIEVEASEALTTWTPEQVLVVVQFGPVLPVDSCPPPPASPRRPCCRVSLTRSWRSASWLLIRSG